MLPLHKVSSEEQAMAFACLLEKIAD